MFLAFNHDLARLFFLNISKTTYHEYMFVCTIKVYKKIRTWVCKKVWLNMIPYHHVLTLCTKTSCFTSAGIQYVQYRKLMLLPYRNKVCASQIPQWKRKNQTQHCYYLCFTPDMLTCHTHKPAHGEPRTQPRHSSTNKHTKNINYEYPNTLTP